MNYPGWILQTVSIFQETKRRQREEDRGGAGEGEGALLLGASLLKFVRKCLGEEWEGEVGKEELSLSLSSSVLSE